jgi:cupin fold WbuC family metalloprotein
MLTLERKTTETYEAKDPVVSVGDEELHFLRRAITLSPRRRTRICTHHSVQEKLHEMFVIYTNDTFVRPNKHVGKDESVFVIEGEADFLFFDDNGAVTQVVEMGDARTGKAYFCRVPQGIYHTIIMRSPEIMLFEATPGPFNPAETLYAEWGPLETDAAGVAAYRRWMDEAIATAARRNPDAVIPLEELGPLVLAATEPVVPWRAAENEFLKTRLNERGLDRLRICAHRSGDDRLHEMLMTFSGSTYIRPSLHVDKEESLYVLEGRATYLFFDETGRVTSRVGLGPRGSGRPFYCRIPANTYHSLVVESEQILVKETTSGPFSRADTRFAPWAPDAADTAAVTAYLATLRAGM